MNLPVDRASSSSSAESPANGPVVRTDRRVLLNTSALAGSSLWRIGLSFVLQLFIANRLGAVGLGQYTTALAYLNVCQILSELGLPQLLVRDLARYPGQKQRSFRLALTLQFSAALLVWGALLALVWLLPFQADTRLALIVITASLPLHAVTSACTTLFQASERMEVVMFVEIAVNTLIVGVSLWLLWQGGTVVHLAAVMIGTQAVSMSLYLWLLRRSKLLTASPFDQNDQSFWQALWGIQRQARPFYGLSLANVLLQRLDILLLSALSGEVVTGIYSAAYLVVRVLMILSQTYWQALYPTLSRLHHQSVAQYRQLSSLATRYGLMVLLPVAALGSDTAEHILGLIFRDELYQESVAVFQVLIWVVPLYFVALYAVNLLLIERRPGQSLSIALVHMAVTALVLAGLAMHLEALGAAFAVLAGVAVSVAFGLILLYRSGLHLQFPHMGTLAVAMVVLFALDLTVNWVFPGWMWIINSVLCTGVYMTVLWYGKFVSTADLSLFRKALRR